MTSAADSFYLAWDAAGLGAEHRYSTWVTFQSGKIAKGRDYLADMAAGDDEGATIHAAQWLADVAEARRVWGQIKEWGDM